MTKVVFLDTGVLGYVTHPRGGDEATRCAQWLISILEAGARVCIPEVCDYELRREYLLNDSHRALARLDDLREKLDYVAVNTEMMRKAAEFWANVRKRGRPTADPKELDVDVILAAQGLLHTSETDELVIATTNVGHLALFASAKAWSEIAP